MFGNRVGGGVERPDGRIEVELRAQSELMVARQLAGFSDGFEVVAPESVRTHLAAIGRGLLRAHA
jgi:predicted DNA-binding transcriptional regulator YafY